MERLVSRRQNTIAAVALSTIALLGCSVDSYLNDPSGVQCDGKRTKVDLAADGVATFTVHGTEDYLAAITVRRSGDSASVAINGDITGPPQQFEADGFTKPTPIVDGAELSAFGAGGAWVIDVQEDSVVIQGSCEGL